MQEPAAQEVGTGGSATGTQSPGSASLSLPSPGSSSPSGSRTATLSANLLSWATFAVITYVWLATSKLDKAPWWGPSGFLVLNALPGGMVVEIVKTVVVVLTDKLPGRGGSTGR